MGDFEHEDDAMSAGEEEEEEEGFLQEDQLPSRRDSASSEHPYKCHICDDGFPDKSCAIEHLETSHSAEYKELVEKGAFESTEEASPGPPRLTRVGRSCMTPSGASSLTTSAGRSSACSVTGSSGQLRT